MKQNSRLDVTQARSLIIGELSSAGITNPLLEADMILSSLLCVPRAYLYTHPEKILPGIFQTFLSGILSRRKQREPLQYILGYTEFYGYRISVGHGCLIPRPETELLVEYALEKLGGDYFLDWGTGSGCISVAMLKEKTSASCMSVDMSSLALSWAWKNMKSHCLIDRCLLWHSSSLQDIPVKDSSLDLIVSNPPYVKSDIIEDLMPEVQIFEPRVALDGGYDGLSLYFQLLKWSARKLKRDAYVLVEIGGPDQAEILKNYQFPRLYLEDIVQDLSNIPRMLSWRRV